MHTYIGKNTEWTIFHRQIKSERQKLKTKQKKKNKKKKEGISSIKGDLFFFLGISCKLE